MENRNSAKGAAPGRSSGQRKGKTTPQLSCEQCRDRKTKCDKLEPCSNCVAFGVACVPIYRLRLPRGRHVHRSRPASASASASALHMVNETLTKRIYRLEALVNGLGPRAAEDALSTDSRDEQATTVPASPTASSSALPRSTKRQPLLQRPEAFWADLVEEIHGLRDAIESAPIEPSENSAQTDAASDDGLRILGLGKTIHSSPVSQYIPPGLASPTCLDPAVTSHLCDVYLRQVDPIVKILHRPSLRKWMLQGERYLSYPERHVSVEALRSAVCYAAINSMTEGQCWVTFHAAKSKVLAHYQGNCETSIERSGLLTTTDVTVLQAFLLYLFARRSQDPSRAVWTLIAVAVRVAKGLSLYLDPDGETFYEQQMRRRLWLTVCLIDLQASFRQATEPLVSVDEAASSLTLPRHINDSDFDPTTTQPVPEREGLTDTTFALITYHAQLGGRLMNFGASKSSRRGASSTFGGDTEREERQRSALRFEEEALRLLHFCDPESSPYAWFTWHGTQSLVAGVRLSALRPLHRSRSGRRAWPPPPRAESDTELLKLTLSALEKSRLMHTDPRGEAFRWYVSIPWHALAIAVAECYVCTDATLVRHAWPIVEESYQHLGDAVVPGPDGHKPHGPLAILMRRARDKLAAMLPRSASAQRQVAVSGSRHQRPLTGFNLTTSNPAFGLLRTSATCPPTPANSAVMVAEPPWAVANMPMLPATPPTSLTTCTPQQHAWSPSSLPLSPQSQHQGLAAAFGVPAGGLTPLQDQASDQSWQVWEEFLSGFSSSDLADHGLFFPESTLGGY